MDVRPLTGDDWQLKRDLRLAALKDSPSAFASTYAREEHRTELEWRGWPHPGAYFCAFDADGTPLGIAGSWVSAAEPGITHLISMWVAPVARGRRVAGALVAAVVGWARERGSDVVELEIAAGNEAAMSAYVRCGFTVTDREPFTAGGTVMRHPLP
ncbi:GNAT family N-acetyltransferase [Dactylosporangium sucinum]|uniref:N-acetyltransferase domain-containing protein n=1 Tax=Dactylosporangium sucinum TaxID=1424081 RepID=A0A917UD53_9ACTN|nr:GNAT family N-acetyltransferase [Dactylosporangium sucinum]GGM84253.1 hypothetical protein GCM10007977_102170 [Dactylosporangium sucinum]